MSWNAGLLFIESTQGQPDELTLGDTTCEEPMVAGQEDEAWAYHVDGHGLVIVTTGMLDPEAVDELAASTKRRVVQVVLGSVADTFEFKVYQDGAQTREIVHVGGETVQESGAPAPAESAAQVSDEEFAEDRFIALFAVAAGLEDLGFLDEGEFSVVDQPQLLVSMY